MRNVITLNSLNMGREMVENGMNRGMRKEKKREEPGRADEEDVASN
jgi:hypothetical protein